MSSDSSLSRQLFFVLLYSAAKVRPHPDHLSRLYSVVLALRKLATAALPLASGSGVKQIPRTPTREDVLGRCTSISEASPRESTEQSRKARTTFIQWRCTPTTASLAAQL